MAGKGYQAIKKSKRYCADLGIECFAPKTTWTPGTITKLTVTKETVTEALDRAPDFIRSRYLNYQLDIGAENVYEEPLHRLPASDTIRFFSRATIKSQYIKNASERTTVVINKA